MFCEFCGKEVEDHAEFCPHCGMALANDSIASTIKGVTERFKKPSFDGPTLDPPKPVNTSTSGASTNSVINTVLAEGEVIVKKYNCADVRGVKGYLTVTNKRLLFNASGGNSRYNQEVTLSSVSGLTCYKGLNVDLKLVIIGGILALLGLGVLTASGDPAGRGSGGATLGFFIMAVGGLMIFLGIRTAFQIAVYAKDVQLSPIVVGEGPKSLLGNSALFAIASTPTVDTDTMLEELGAMVQDLQSMGDLAIEKWQNRFDPKELPSL